MKNIIILSFLFISFNAYSQKTIITEFKLKNGYTVRGSIIDSIPNKSYTIKTLKGIEQAYTIEEIENISNIIIGKDKVDYIPKGKFSANIEFGLLNISTEDKWGKDYYKSQGTGILYGISLNYNLIKNLELAMSFNPLIFKLGNQRSTQLGNSDLNYYTKDEQTDVSVKIFQNAISLKKYFTRLKFKPFIGIGICYNFSSISGSNSHYYYKWVNSYWKRDGGIIQDFDLQKQDYLTIDPTLGFVYFFSKRICVSTSYKYISIAGAWADLSVKDSFIIGSLKYTFIK